MIHYVDCDGLYSYREARAMRYRRGVPPSRLSHQATLEGGISRRVEALLREEVLVKSLPHEQAEDDLAEAVFVVRHHLHESNTH